MTGIRPENVDDQNEVICLVFIFSSYVMFLKLSKIVHLLQFCADLSKKPKPIKAITYMHLKVLITQVLRVKSCHKSYSPDVTAVPYRSLS